MYIYIYTHNGIWLSSCCFNLEHIYIQLIFIEVLLFFGGRGTGGSVVTTFESLMLSLLTAIYHNACDAKMSSISLFHLHDVCNVLYSFWVVMQFEEFCQPLLEFDVYHLYPLQQRYFTLSNVYSVSLIGVFRLTRLHGNFNYISIIAFDTRFYFVLIRSLQVNICSNYFHILSVSNIFCCVTTPLPLFPICYMNYDYHQNYLNYWNKNCDVLTRLAQ